MTISETSAAYKVLKDEIQIDPTNDLDKFIYYTDLQTATDVGFLFGIDKAIIKLNK